MSGVRPMTLNADSSSSANMSGDAPRLARHQRSISRIWTSASGVVRTGRLTAADGVRPESLTRDEDGPLPPIPTTPTALHQGRALVVVKSSLRRRGPDRPRRAIRQRRRSVQEEAALDASPKTTMDSLYGFKALVRKAGSASALRAAPPQGAGAPDGGPLPPTVEAAAWRTDTAAEFETARHRQTNREEGPRHPPLRRDRLEADHDRATIPRRHPYPGVDRHV